MVAYYSMVSVLHTMRMSCFTGVWHHSCNAASACHWAAQVISHAGCAQWGQQLSAVVVPCCDPCARVHTAQAAHGGDTTVRLYWNTSQARDIFYARYIDWFITTPLLLLDLLLLSAVPVGTVLWCAALAALGEHGLVTVSESLRALPDGEPVPVGTVLWCAAVAALGEYGWVTESG